jgi:hypothetical protein
MAVTPTPTSGVNISSLSVVAYVIPVNLLIGKFDSQGWGSTYTTASELGKLTPLIAAAFIRGG